MLVWISVLLNALATFYQGFQAYQSRKSNLDQVENAHQERFDTLLLDIKNFRNIIDDPKCDLAAIEKKDKELYATLVAWAERYFWLCFDEWRRAHVWKSVPRFITKDWDAGIVEAMKAPFFQQIWQRTFTEKNFRGYGKFNKFIDACIRKSQI